MKKYIWFLLVLTLSCFNTKSNNKEDEKYYEIKKNFIKSKEKNYSELTEFYNNYKKKEIKESKAFLDKLYEEGKDEEALKYILNNLDTINRTYYLLNLYNDGCKTDKCVERLLKFIDYEYSVTKDIERFSSILEYEKEILKNKKYKELEEFSIKNNSLYAINIKKREENKIEDEFKNPKIKIKNTEYIILQEKEMKLLNNQKIKLYFLMNNNDDNIDSYLYYRNKDKEFLTKVEIHTVGFPNNIILRDLNGDNQDEIIVENLMDILSDLYIFEITEKGIEKRLNTQDIKFEKYFTYQSNVKNIVVNIKDDFGYKKKLNINCRIKLKIALQKLLTELYMG